jgi:hypothetical protein
MVQYQDIIEDVNRKTFLLDKWHAVYKLAEHYEGYLHACYGSQAINFIYTVGHYANEFYSIKHFVYDLPCMLGLADFLRLWNSYDLKGMYIYRATTVDYIDYYITSDTPFMVADPEHMSENRLISYWSVSPYTSDYFIRKYMRAFRLDASSIRVLVTYYDDAICSKDWYDNFSTEYTIIEGDKPYNFGAMQYLRELEVRCFKYPSSRLVYVLTVDDFMELMKYLPKKYVYHH